MAMGVPIQVSSVFSTHWNSPTDTYVSVPVGILAGAIFILLLPRHYPLPEPPPGEVPRAKAGPIMKSNLKEN